MSHNGWANWETWNVALWLGNDEGLYGLMAAAARLGRTYDQFADELRELGVTETPDQVAYNDSGLDRGELNRMMNELGQ